MQPEKQKKPPREILALVFMASGFLSLIAGIACVFAPEIAAIVGGAILLIGGIVVDWRG